MVFSSLVFICIFLPIVFGLYCIVPSLKVKNGLLIGASLLFYSFGEPVYVFLMLFSSLVNYACARGIGALEEGQRERKAVLVAAILVNIGLLVIFKYLGMLVGTVNTLLPIMVDVPDVLLPIGISFYTFQALSYVIDVYWNRVEAQRSYAKVLLYISFFPQLIAGPIVKYHDISVMIDNRKQTHDQVTEGLRRFICGLAKKVLIANNMALVADACFGAGLEQVNWAVAWIGALAYMMQIYYDFSGYSDMAIGLGKMFGFQFKENFKYPYASRSIQEFWRRWHISLSTWFKEYVYIPLGGNRKGFARTQINKVTVFLVTGLWHGASWTFVLWGMYHGAFMLLEGFVPALKKMPRALGHIYAMVVVLVGWVLFRADTLPQAGYFIAQMFTGFGPNAAAMSFACQQLSPLMIVVFIVAVIGCAPIRPLVDRVRVALGVRTQDDRVAEAIANAKKKAEAGVAAEAEAGEGAAAAVAAGEGAEAAAEAEAAVEPERAVAEPEPEPKRGKHAARGAHAALGAHAASASVRADGAPKVGKHAAHAAHAAPADVSEADEPAFAELTFAKPQAAQELVATQAAGEAQQSSPDQGVSLSAAVTAQIAAVAVGQPSAHSKALHIAVAVGSVLLLAWCMLRLSGGTYNPFIYFRF